MPTPDTLSRESRQRRLRPSGRTPAAPREKPAGTCGTPVTRRHEPTSGTPSDLVFVQNRLTRRPRDRPYKADVGGSTPSAPTDVLPGQSQSSGCPVTLGQHRNTLGERIETRQHDGLVALEERYSTPCRSSVSMMRARSNAGLSTTARSPTRQPQRSRRPAQHRAERTTPAPLPSSRACGRRS